MRNLRLIQMIQVRVRAVAQTMIMLAITMIVIQATKEKQCAKIKESKRRKKLIIIRDPLLLRIASNNSDVNNQFHFLIKVIIKIIEKCLISV